MKRIIYCLDGTWNSDKPGSILTNVAKLQQAVLTTDANGIRQVSQYFAGIASTDGEKAQFLKGAVGYGVSDRIRLAYEALTETYEQDDEIYLFGFSRGAFEVRSLASFISLFGIATRNAGFAFDAAWALYRRAPQKRPETTLATIRAKSRYPVRIKCVGVWDTVGNIGNPFFSSGPIGRKFKFHDTQLNPGIEVALHALSVDEVRGTFRPTLWSKPKDSELPSNQHVEQVWFPGTHSDVGGGCRESQLADVALLWMVDRASTTTGLLFDKDMLTRTTRPDPLGPQHSAGSGSAVFWNSLLPFIRLIKQAVEAIPVWRRSLIGTWRTGKLPGTEVSINESIHPSVLERLGKRVIELRDDEALTRIYRPANLAPVQGLRLLRSIQEVGVRFTQ